jgi:hypothetical protein
MHSIVWEASHEGVSLPRSTSELAWHYLYLGGGILEHRWKHLCVLERTSASELALVIERELQEAVAAVDVELVADG